MRGANALRPAALAAAAGLAFAACSGIALAAPAGGSQQPSAATKLAILWLDGTSLGDWANPDLPAFSSYLSRASVALVSTRTAGDESDPVAMRLSAAVGVGAAARASVDARTRRVGPDDAQPGGGGLAIEDSGRTAVVLGDADGRDLVDRSAGWAVLPRGVVGPAPPQALDAPAPAAPSRRDAAFPTGRRADTTAIARAVAPALERAAVVLVDPGDTARVMRGARDDAQEWIDLSMRRADALLAAMVKAAGDDIAVAVIAPTPTMSRRTDGIRLGAMAIAGPGVPAGLMRTGTTRRDGVVTLADAGATLLSVFSLPLPPGAEGRPATFAPRPGAIEATLALERDLVHSALARHPLTRRGTYAAMAIVALSLLTVIAGRGRAPARRRAIPRGWRDGLGTALVAAAALPLGIYVEGAFPTTTAPAALLAVSAFAVALAIAARAPAGGERALGWVLCATAIVPVADLLTGTDLGVRSPLSFQIAGGGRFFGIDDGVLGMVVGAAVVGPALLLDRRPRLARRGWAWLALALFAIAFVLGSPWHGAKAGAALTAIPAFGMLVVRAAGARLDRHAILGIAIAATLLSGLLVAGDSLQAAESRTHVGRAVEGSTAIGPLVRRKIEATWHIATTTFWTPAIGVFAGALGLLVTRRRGLFDRGMWGRPHLRAALAGCAVSAAGGMGFQDGGTITAALLLLPAAAAAVLVLLSPDP